MKSVVRTAALAVFGGMMVPSAPVVAQGYVANAPDPYVHKAVGVGMPGEVAGLARKQVAEYDAEGSDAAASYFAQDGVSRFTLYIYPARGDTCKGTFDAAKAAIDEHSGAKLQKNARAIRLNTFAGSEQHSAQYAIAADSYGSPHPRLQSQLWIGCVPGGQWFVKYRGSYVADDSSFEDIAERFLNGFDWSPLLDTHDDHSAH